MNDKFKYDIFSWAPLRRLAFISLTVILASCGDSNGDGSVSAPGAAVAMNQGAAWNASNQAAFYSTDQGSWIIPYQWAKALKN